MKSVAAYSKTFTNIAAVRTIRSTGSATSCVLAKKTSPRNSTLNRFQEAFLGYFTTGGANNGDTEAINGLIELARRVATGFCSPENYRLRMLLVGSGLNL